MSFVQTEQINTELADEYMHLLTRRNERHAKCAITFSGTPGSGKSTLALKLAHDLGAQYIHHDTIRKIAEAHGYDPSKMSMAAISRVIVERILRSDDNKLLLLDSSIDRSWKAYTQYMSSHSVKSFLIRMDIPHKVIDQRLLARDGAQHVHVRNIKKFISQYEDCKLHVPADIVLGETYDYDIVLTTIKKFISA